MSVSVKPGDYISTASVDVIDSITNEIVGMVVELCSNGDSEFFDAYIINENSIVTKYKNPVKLIVNPKRIFRCHPICIER